VRIGKARSDPDDLERLATAAYLIGRDDEAVAIWARAHQELITRGHRERAERSAFWLAFGLLHKGDHGRQGCDGHPGAGESSVPRGASSAESQLQRAVGGSIAPVSTWRVM
jgi:hypothetical protein